MATSDRRDRLKSQLEKTFPLTRIVNMSSTHLIHFRSDLSTSIFCFGACCQLPQILCSYFHSLGLFQSSCQSRLCYSRRHWMTASLIPQTTLSHTMSSRVGPEMQILLGTVTTNSSGNWKWLWNLYLWISNEHHTNMLQVRPVTWLLRWHQAGTQADLLLLRKLTISCSH